MTLHTLLLWMGIGLVAGWTASAAVGSGFGLIGDMFIGIIGAFLGGLLFRRLGIETHLWGLPSTIFVAFVGAVLLLLVLRVVRRSLTH
jgi:uncharacterized membrane protein YeaQ/YmgE (transglycosylase-associated protein family)